MFRKLSMVLAVILLVGLVAAPNASAHPSTITACQGQVGCDSGWIETVCNIGPDTLDVQIRVIWRGTGLREVYWSGSYTYSSNPPDRMYLDRVWVSTPPNGQWVLKGEYSPGPAVGQFYEVTYSVSDPNTPHHWQVRQEDYFANWCSTVQVLN